MNLHDFESPHHVDHVLNEGLSDYSHFSIALGKIWGVARRCVDDHSDIKSFWITVDVSKYNLEVICPFIRNLWVHNLQGLILTVQGNEVRQSHYIPHLQLIVQQLHLAWIQSGKLRIHSVEEISDWRINPDHIVKSFIYKGKVLWELFSGKDCWAAWLMNNVASKWSPLNWY